jgi:hypothetical protein
MSFNYTGFVSALANLSGTLTTNPYFQTELPNAIDYAEQRLFRDLDLIVTITTDASQACVPSNRNLTAPAAFIVIDGINIITPAGTTNPDNGKRNRLVKTSQDVLDWIFPDASIVGPPTRWALASQWGIILGPWPDANYTAEIVGTQRPAPLSAANPNTFLATYLPDLMLVAAQMHMALYQKNWSALGDDAQSSQTLETQYGKLLASADAEELRKRYTGSAVFPPWGEAKTPAAPDAKG